MQYPKWIKPGDKIGVTATSEGNGDELHIKKLDSAKMQFKDKGYFVEETSNVRKNYKGRSSTKETRAKEFMNLIQNPDIKAIITARGGEFLLEILPYIDFPKIKENPKWIQGYSDTTGLNFCITTICDIPTLYAENFNTFAMKPWHESLENNLKILEGKVINQKSFAKYQEGWQEEVTGQEPYMLSKDVEWKNARKEPEIRIRGRVLGGCLDILISLVGTKYDNVNNFCNKYDTDGIIWFFDNCELTSENVLRGLWQLKEASWFSNARGFIFGRTMTRKSSVNISFEESVMEILEDLKVPIIFEADIGHVAPQMTLINGAIADIKSKKGKGEILFDVREK